MTRPFMLRIPPYIMSTVISPTLTLPYSLRKALTSSCTLGILSARAERRSVAVEARHTWLTAGLTSF
ncbi:MAG: hypothetical protein ACK559_31750 [bacterium]